MVQVDFSREWRILARFSSSDLVATLAAVELSLILKQVTGHDIPVVTETSAGRPIIRLWHEEGEEDGFDWQAGHDSIDLHGHNARGLLYAVYDFLEVLGCRWITPSDGSATHIPSAVRFELPGGKISETPALPGRCLIVGHYAFMQQVEEWIIWAARNRLNTVFLHVTTQSPALGLAPECQWLRHKEAAVRLARQRGMTIEYGGHGLTELLPRKFFKQMPNAFRFYNGRRTPNHNFCPTNEAGLAVIRHNAEKHFRSHPEVDVFHLWPDDIAEGGWCACERCQGYTPSEQALLAVNTVAEVLEAINPKAQISFLAYHDTEQVPAKVAPRYNVCMLWAPRKRCYAHATDAAACSVNTPHYSATFREQIRHFHAVGAAPGRVFEYYLDAILFKSVLPPLLNVMRSDLRFYREAGAHTVQALMTGDYPWVSAQLNAWCFARLAWNPDQDLENLLAGFCQKVFGISDDHMPAYYRLLEQAFKLALELDPQQIRLVDDIHDIWDNPPTDMGDPAFAPPEVLKHKSQQNTAILDLVSQATGHLEAARSTSNPENWQAEQVNFELIRPWLRFDYHRLRLYEATYRVKGGLSKKSEAYHWLKQAQNDLDAVLAWGQKYLREGGYRANFRLIHWVMWGISLNWIRGEHFTNKLGQWLIKIRCLAQANFLLLKVRFAYK